MKQSETGGIAARESGARHRPELCDTAVIPLRYLTKVRSLSLSIYVYIDEDASRSHERSLRKTTSVRAHDAIRHIHA